MLENCFIYLFGFFLHEDIARAALVCVGPCGVWPHFTHDAETCLSNGIRA